MQVADIQNTATAATLGAQETTAFTMVQDASFLMMLSANLYSNQQLACIRETMCNAWDAHIEAGRTNLPLHITITAENELVIQDSGKGIPADRITEVYGTYGASTKKNDGKQTGGFGLGCKSPFAYVESFRVISENQGRKVVYNMTRASLEADGLPGITKVMELPTDRTGLTVRFQLRPEDIGVMIIYIRSIAMHGEMLVEFKNATQEDVVTAHLVKLGMDETPGSYNIEDNLWYQHYMGSHSIFVRYGAVIYPMLQTPGTQKAVNLLKQFMEMVGFRRMVVQAAPGTLALTPSREALSSQRMTEDGLTDLCVSLVARIEDDIIRQIPASIKAAEDVLRRGDNYFSGLEQYSRVLDVVEPIPVRRYLSCSLGAARYAKYEKILQQAEHHGFKKKHSFENNTASREYHKLRCRLKDKDYKTKHEAKFTFIKHFIFRPLSRIFMNNKEILDLKNFYHSANFWYTNTSGGKRPLSHRLTADEWGMMKQLVDKPIVFITSRLKKLKESIEDCPDLFHGQASWVYKVTPKDANKDAIIKAFTDAGMTVIDLTLNHSWDDAAQDMLEANQRRASTKKVVSDVLPGMDVKKQANLLIPLSSIYSDDGTRKISTINLKMIKASKNNTNTPLFYLDSNELNREGKIGGFGYYQDLSEEERKQGVVVRTGTERNMAIKRGAVHADNYLAKRLWNVINTKEYKTYITKQRKAGLEDDHHIYPNITDIVTFLGVKIPGLDKLTENPVFDRAYGLLRYLNQSSFSLLVPELTEKELGNYSVIDSYTLEEPPCVASLKVLKNDRIFNGLISNCSNFVSALEKNPKYVPAIKLLATSIIKNGSLNE